MSDTADTGDTADAADTAATGDTADAATAATGDNIAATGDTGDTGDNIAGNQEKLVALVDGRSDEEINAAVAEHGIDNVLGQVFAGMQSRFQPEKAAGQNAVVQWDINSAEGTKNYQLKIADGTCEVEEGPAEKPRVTLAFAVADFLRFAAGKLDGMQAFMTGKLRLSGDMMFAQMMAAWFGR